MSYLSAHHESRKVNVTDSDKEAKRTREATPAKVEGHKSVALTDDEVSTLPNWEGKGADARGKNAIIAIAMAEADIQRERNFRLI